MPVHLFLAGPGNTRTPAFNAAAAHLEALGYTTETAHCFVLGDYPDVWSAFVRDDLAGCDGVAVLDGWQDAPGACYEIGVAHGLDIPIRGLDWWAERTPAAAAERLAELREDVDRLIRKI